ncbi:hypothetical protein [Zavarzinella formosa]|uniref:hypothetical protein n=1 Tax=Zavarzinella formosa TaxID=360055 RepID=UPI0002E967E3|nr:hypothetical protein [Zavarzinella formosa]
MMKIACRHRGTLVSPGVHRCESPKLIGLKLVSEAMCGTCHHRDHAPVSPAAEPPARLHPCLRLGQEIAPEESANGSRIALPVFECLHPEHPRTTESQCRRCPDYLFPVITPETSPSDIGAMLDLPPRAQPDGWWNWPNVQEGLRQAASRFIANMPAYPGGYEGRGIVIVGGGAYFPSAYVTIRVLRHVGCRLPIQLWHFAGEMTDAMREVLKPHDVECVNADELTARHPFRFLKDHWWKGWQLKPYAIMHSSFREVFFLDADCYPTRDPAFMFDWPPYRERGATFWPDLATSEHLLPSDRWGVFGTKPGWLPLESGQLMVNKETCWREMRLALWYNERADYVYHLLYGDKDTFNIAWRRLGTYYAMTQPRPGWDLHTYLHYGPDGEVLLQHRTRDKFKLDDQSFSSAPTPQQAGANVRHHRLKLEDVCFGFLEELRLSNVGATDTTISSLTKSNKIRPRDHLGRIFAGANHPTEALSPVRDDNRADGRPFDMNRPLPGLVPRWTHQFGPGLVPATHQTNCSLIHFKGRLLLAYRTGWVGANIHIVEIGPDMIPDRSKTISLSHPMCVDGQEDPRLFVHEGALHLSFIGVRLRQPGNHTVARQLFSRLDNDLNAVRVWEPRYDRSTEWEKNWQPFSHDGRLFVVYSMQPWVVLELAGDLALPVSEMAGVPWKFGLPRGGAAPVLHNGEWHAFFHGTDKSGYDRGLPAIYTTGACTFENKPPFKPLRITREPILWPVMSDLPKGPHGGKSWYAATAFPCGAYLDGDQWVVSYGHNDHWCRVSAFDAKQIEERLCPI